MKQPINAFIYSKYDALRSVKQGSCITEATLFEVGVYSLNGVFEFAIDPVPNMRLCSSVGRAWHCQGHLFKSRQSREFVFHAVS